MKQILNSLAIKVIGAAFLISLSMQTTWQYSHLQDHWTVMPWNIIEGKSTSPNQYRIVTPLLFSALRSLVPYLNRAVSFPGYVVRQPRKLADRITLFVSVLFCYTACLVLLMKFTGNPGLSALLLLALYGTFQSGFIWQSRQEFFERD